MNLNGKKRELEKELEEIRALLQRQEQRRSLLNKIRSQSAQLVLPPKE